MKILILNIDGAPLHDPSLPAVFGGAEVDLYLLANLFLELGHEVHVLVRRLEGKASRNIGGIRLHPLWPRGQAARSPFHFAAIYRRIAQIKPELLMCELISDFSAVAGLYARWSRTPMIYRAANKRDWLLVQDPGQYGWRDRLIFKATLAGLGHYVAQTEEQRSVLSTLLPEQRLRILPNFHPPQQVVIPEFGERRGILWVGHLTKVKQPMRLVELARLLPEIPFTVIAPTTASSEQTESREAIQRLENVHLVDSVPFHEIQACYNRARILLNTSLSEGFPNTFIHAMNGETPIAAVNINPDGFFDEGQSGGIREEQIPFLAEQLRRLHGDQDFWQRSREMLVAYRDKHFAYEPVRAGWERLLQEVRSG